ncbi:response regulator transcription factor [Streptomyces sp. NBC_00287]|uniref:response regulator n=1 Tax=Streptomyces sp. NBC_00287 TaxID=2975702 RepID=UPI002E296D5C|nr:response regulator transcription factor [Streptomyces sp. NBC_00287]
MTLRCLIVDDSARFLEAARAFLERGGVRVVGTARSSAQALARARETAVDVALVDIGLGDEDGFEVARLLADRVPTVLLISTHAREDFQELIAASPARGFLPKSALSARAIREALGDRGPSAPA